MSVYYAEKNAESAKNLFRKRKIYRGTLAATQDHQNLINFNFAEKYMYGRVDRQFIPIMVDGTSRLKSFRSSVAKETNLQALDFVVDAFELLADQFKKCAISGKISTRDRFLSNLTVFKAYKSPNRAYDDHLKMYFERIAFQFKKRKIKVKNFDDFIMHFMKMLEATARQFPFTKTAYVKSRFCPMLANGISLEIANLAYANDDEKIQQFIESDNWDFYVNACNDYGFMVDQNVPWRLVADIASPTCRATFYGLNSVDEILSARYTPVHLSYFNSFANDLLRLYNEAKRGRYQELCEHENVIFIKRKKTTQYTRPQFALRYPELYFLKLYFKIRFLEEESQFVQSEKNILADDAEEIFVLKGAVSALAYFERIVNKTFDYQGSLSYINKELKLDEGGLEALTMPKVD
jgi:hypothetical protein